MEPTYRWSISPYEDAIPGARLVLWGGADRGTSLGRGGCGHMAFTPYEGSPHDAFPRPHHQYEGMGLTSMTTSEANPGTWIPPCESLGG